MEAGDLPGARASIARALALRDDQTDILLLDARIKFQMGDLRGAFDAYRTVLAFDSRNLEALAAVSQTGVALNERDVARDSIKRALAIDPGQPEALLSWGILMIDQKKFDDAMAAGRRLLAAHPADPRGVVLQARGMFLKGQTAESLELLNGAIDRLGNSQWIAAAMLENARAEGNVPLMREQFALLREANPDSADLALDEINTHYKSGNPAVARQMASRFIDRFGDDAGMMVRLVDLWREYDRSPLEQAEIEALARSARAEARLAAGRYFLDRSDLARTELMIRHAPDARFMGLIARLHVRRGSPQGLDLASDILRADKTNCDALSALSEWNLATHEPRRAIVSSQILAVQCRDRIDGYVQQAKAYAALGRAAATERVYREAIDAHPQNPVLTEAFAAWLLARGRKEAAISAARRLSKAAPSRSSTWRIFESVCRKAGDAPCLQNALRGHARSSSQYVLDPLPGIRPSDPLFGRTWN